MLSAHQILNRRMGKFGLLWLAATAPKMIKNSSLLTICLADLTEELTQSVSRGHLVAGALYSKRYFLHLSAKLLTGLWVLYRKKVAALKAKAEERLRMLTTRKHLRDQDANLLGAVEKGKKRRRKGSPPEAATEPPSVHFGKVLSNEETPEELIVDRLPPVPSDTLTVDRERITVREEVSLRLDPLHMEDDQEQLPPAEGEDFLEELDRLVALLDGTRGAGEEAAAQQGTAGGRPVSPILPRFPRGGTPPPHCPPPDSAVQEAGGEPPSEPPFEAEVEETAGELQPMVVDTGLPEAASKPDTELDAEPMAVPPSLAEQPPPEAVQGPSGAASPALSRSPGGGRRRRAMSPPAGPQPRRRRRQGPIVDRQAQISMEELRENVRANNQLGRPAAFLSLAQLLQDPDVQAVFQLPGGRLLTERLRRPWKLAQTQPEPDEQEPAEEEPAEGGVQEEGEQPPPQEAAPEEREEEPREPSLPPPRDDEGSLELVREPSASSSGLEAGMAGRPSVVSLLSNIQQEEEQQQPGGVVTAEPPVVAVDLGLIPEEEEERLSQEQQEEALPQEGGIPGDGVVGASPGHPAGPSTGASFAEGTAASPSQGEEEPGRLSSLWGRLLEVSDAYGMCTLELLVPPEAFNRRTVAATVATLLRMHQLGMVWLEQFNPCGPVVITCLEEQYHLLGVGGGSPGHPAH